MSAHALLELDALRVRQGGFELDLSCRLEGGVTGLVGSSGSGKTTLLHAVAGLLRPQGGRVVLGGAVLSDAGGGDFVPPEARGIGYVFQEGRLFPHLSVEANLRFGERPGAVSFAQVVEVLELGALLKRAPQTLSGGERQRVALGRALLMQPRLLL